MFPRTGAKPDIKMDVSSHVETCVLLVREQSTPSDTVSIKVDMKGANIRQHKPLESEKATYDSIKTWVEEKYSFKVSSLYIAQVKKKLGIRERENYNIGEGKGRVPHCPPDKEEAILDAFRHFNIIK